MKQNVLLGAPGAGKGTLSQKLMSVLPLKHISTGDLLRQEISNKSQLGCEISEIISKGQLVDDDCVVRLILANTDLNSNTYLFDGFPRTLAQAKLLDEKIFEKKSSLIVYLKADLDFLKKRILNRRTCSGRECGEIYNLVSKPSAIDGICDLCGSILEIRKDDNPTTVNSRFKIFEENIDELLSYYKCSNRLLELDAQSNLDDFVINFKNKSMNCS